MFYKAGVDIASTKSMWEFLHNHYTYHTMNSWNNRTSIANNVKLYNLGLDGDWTTAMAYLFDESDFSGLQMDINDEIRNFEEEYPWTKVFFNGRSNGYLVLGTKLSAASVLPDCVSDYDSYEDFKSSMKDQGFNVSDFKRELRDTVEVVREFDKLCDRLRDIVNDYSLRNFNSDKLEAAVNDFYFSYEEDLTELGLTGPEFIDGKVKLNCLAQYKTFMDCFLIGLDTESYKIDSDKEYLWLKEI